MLSDHLCFLISYLPGIPYSRCHHWGCSADERGCGRYHGYPKRSCKRSRHGWRHGRLHSRGNEQGEHRHQSLFQFSLESRSTVQGVGRAAAGSLQRWLVTDVLQQETQRFFDFAHCEINLTWVMVLMLPIYAVPVSRITAKYFYSVTCWY